MRHQREPVNLGGHKLSSVQSAKNLGTTRGLAKGLQLPRRKHHLLLGFHNRYYVHVVQVYIRPFLLTYYVITLNWFCVSQGQQPSSALSQSVLQVEGPSRGRGNTGRGRERARGSSLGRGSAGSSTVLELEVVHCYVCLSPVFI